MADAQRRQERDRWVFGAAALIAFAVLLVIGSSTTFRVDDWELIANRSLADPASLIRPWNEQMILVPAVVFRVLFGVVGLHSYIPYLVVLLLLHIATAAILMRLVGALAGSSIGLAAGIVMLFLGGGYENLETAFQIGQVLATAAGLEAIDAVAIRRRPGLAAGLLLIGLGSHAVAGAYLIGAIAIQATVDRRGLAWFLFPMVTGGIWFILLDVPSFVAHDEPLSEALKAIPLFMLAGPFAAAGAVFGLGLAGGVVVVGWSAAFARITRLRPANRVVIVAAFVAILAEYALIAFSRAAYGVDATTWSRYVYSAVPLVIVAAAAWIGPRPAAPPGWRPRWAAAALSVAVAVAVAGNLRAYASARFIADEGGQLIRAAAAIVDWSPAAGVLRADPLLPPPARLRVLFAESGSPARDALVPLIVTPVSGSIASQACREMLGDQADPGPCLAAIAERVGP